MYLTRCELEASVQEVCRVQGRDSVNTITNLRGGSTNGKKFHHQPSDYQLPKKGFLYAGITRNAQPYTIFTSYVKIP